MRLRWTKGGVARQYGIMSLLLAIFAIFGWQPAIAAAIPVFASQAGQSRAVAPS